MKHNISKEYIKKININILEKTLKNNNFSLKKHILIEKDNNKISFSQTEDDKKRKFNYYHKNRKEIEKIFKSPVHKPFLT